MKKISTILAFFTFTIIFAQSQFQNIATSNGSAERITVFGVDDVSNNFLEITNSTVEPNKFIPTIWAHQQADNRYVLRNFVTTNSVNDNGTIPLMIFRTELRNQLNLTAPNEAPFPWSGTSGNVLNRPLFAWENGNTQLMRIAANGNVTIGTALTPISYKLAVGGKIIAEELKIQLQSAPWPDYVFAKDYKLPTLLQVEKQIKEKGHLVNVPSANVIKTDGFEVGTMAKIQMEKIEELTLYIIEQNKEIDILKTQMKILLDKK